MYQQRVAPFISKNTTFLKQLAGSYVVFGLNILAVLWQTPFLLSHIGKEMYGVWILSNTLLSYLALCSFGFLNTFFVEYSKLGSKSVDHLYSNTFYSILLLYFLSIPLYLLLGIFCTDIFKLSEENIASFKLIYAINFATYTTNFFIAFYVGIVYWVKKWIHLKNLFEMIGILGNSVAIYFLIGKMNLPLFSLFIYQACISLGFLVTYIILFRKEISYRFDFSFLSYFKQKLKTSFHFFLLNSTNLFAFLGDNLLISVLAGVSSLPFYSISFRISDYSIKIIRKIVEVKGPELVEAIKRGNVVLLKKLYRRVFGVSVLLALLACVSIIFLGQQVLELWIGNKITFDSTLIAIFAIYIPISISMHVNWVMLNLLAKHKVLSYVVVIEVALNIFLSIYLQKEFGLIGLGAATVLSTVMCSWWYSFYKVRKELRRLVPLT